MAEEDYTGEDASPSQRLLDQQTQQGDIQAVGNYQGRLDMAKGLVIVEVQEGGNAAEGRRILGDLDQLAQYPDMGDHETVYKDVRKFIKGQGAAPQAAAQSSTPPKKTVDRSKAMADYASGKITTSRARELGIV